MHVEGDYINWTWINKIGMKLSILEDRIFRLCVAISCWILTSLFCGFSLLSFMWSASHIEQLDYPWVHTAIWIVHCRLDCCLEQRRWLYIAFWGKETSSFLWMRFHCGRQCALFSLDCHQMIVSVCHWVHHLSHSSIKWGSQTLVIILCASLCIFAVFCLVIILFMRSSQAQG